MAQSDPKCKNEQICCDRKLHNTGTISSPKYFTNKFILNDWNPLFLCLFTAALINGLSFSFRSIGSKGHGRGSAMRGNTKDTKTIYDMITHLSGQSVPGIPVNLPLPADPVGRVKQLYWQHSTLLTFLKYISLYQIFFLLYFFLSLSGFFCFTILINLHIVFFFILMPVFIFHLFGFI